jgi:hypothetical protein
MTGNAKKISRNKYDDYPTPFSITRHLFDFGDFDYTKSVLEPACGVGAAVLEIYKKFKKVTYYDKYIYLVLDWLNMYIVRDFILEEDRQFDYIITNPPFQYADQFVLKCKEVAIEKFALLLPVNYLHGLYRYNNIYQDKDFPLEWVNIFVRYPMFTNIPAEKYHTGQLVFAWYIWNKEYQGYPKIRHIDNQEDIL